MNKNRITLETSIIQTRAEMEALVGQIAALQLQLNERTARMDQDLTDIRAQYEGVLDHLAQEIQTRTALVEGWADSHPEEFPEGKKSIDIVHGSIGFRTDPPKVLPVRKRFTVKIIVSLLKKVAWGPKYIRQPDPQIDKEAILQDRKTLTEEQLAKVGLKIVQDESFYIDLKATPTETRIVQDSKEAA
jgi:phage host-nuclease inhibitor protein Gam